MFDAIVETTAQLDVTLRPAVLETQLVRMSEFDAAEAEVWAKTENHQVTGSFKFRGASAKVASLETDEMSRQIVTASTGNHGLAVAAAASAIGGHATVFVSDAADATKVERMRSAGAHISVVPGDPVLAEIAARRSAAESGGTFISPYNDATVVAGQGTIGAELVRQLPNLAGVVVSVGGGGLISGIAATLKAQHKDIRVVAASAANSAAMHQSVGAGEIITTTHLPTLSDGTAGGIEPGAVTFPMCQALVDDWILVDEPEIADAMKVYYRATGEVIEGSAGVALAALPAARIEGPVAVVICGANVSTATMAQVGIR